MTAATTPQRITGRAALAHIIAAIDAGAPCPAWITGLDDGAVVQYHRRPGRDSHASAAAMVRALGLAAEPQTRRFDDYHTVTWETWEYDPICRWSVVAYIDGEPEPAKPALIADPVELAAAYGLTVDPTWMTPSEHPDGTYGQGGAA